MPELVPNNLTLPDSIRYMVVEGVIGAGKSELARLLAERLDLRVILENKGENLFLKRFYRDPKRWAFQTQVAFLTSRYRQLSALRSLDLFHRGLITNFSFDKDRIFAHMNLSGDDLHLYEMLYAQMDLNTPRPDLVVYLQSSVERSIKSIRVRGRQSESGVTRDYIARLHDAYTYYFFRYTKSPLLIIDVENLDFENSSADLDELVHQIVRVPQPGITYFKAGAPAVFA